LADADDRWHVEAARVLRRTHAHNQRLVTSNHVIGETYTLLRMRLGHAAAQEFLRRSRASARTRRVFVPEAWEEEAEAVLAQFADQDFSFVDATSFVVMRMLRMRTAFAFDHHFLVAGYLLVADS
jgi:uncharacterized protein